MRTTSITQTIVEEGQPQNQVYTLVGQLLERPRITEADRTNLFDWEVDFRAARDSQTVARLFGDLWFEYIQPNYPNEEKLKRDVLNLLQRYLPPGTTAKEYLNNNYHSLLQKARRIERSLPTIARTQGNLQSQFVAQTRE
jgi:hypothetical protein